MINTINPPKKKAANIRVDKLRTFEGHPFKVLDDEDMDILTESIKEQGILCPLIVRPIENTDEYEVVSGTRRRKSRTDGCSCFNLSLQPKRSDDCGGRQQSPS